MAAVNGVPLHQNTQETCAPTTESQRIDLLEGLLSNKGVLRV